MRRLAFFLLLASCFLLPYTVSAQVLGDLSGYGSPALETVVEPQYPGPHQAVTVAVVSSDPSTDSADYTWRLNGAVALQGPGDKRFTFTTGAIGEKDIVTLSMSYQNGQSNTQTFTIEPAGLDLIWEAKTTVPSWYRGKALYSPGAPLLLYASANFPDQPSPSSLNYAWSEDGQNLTTYSGLGRDTLSIAPPEIDRATTFQVIVSDVRTGARAEQTTTITPVLPYALLYANDPLYGFLTQRALSGQVSLTTSQITVDAVPFYFPGLGSTLSYQWSVGGQSVQNPSSMPREIILRSQGGSGSSVLSVEVQNTQHLFSDAQSNVTITYGAH